jgi:hypothetical protein
LNVVQTGEIMQFDITNINLSFPTIDPLTFAAASSIGLDNADFVDPITALPLFHDANQGLAVIGYHDQLFGNVFLSITLDNPGGNEFNAIDGGPGSLGFGQAHWTASFRSVNSVPEPASWILLVLGVAGIAGYRKVRR